MGHIEVAHVDYYLPDGRLLLADATFRIGESVSAALVGPNGAGKSTLLRMIAGGITADSGVVTTSGGVAVMPQFIGSIRDERTVRDLLVLTAPQAMRQTGTRLSDAEAAMRRSPSEQTQMDYAQAVVDWGDIGGYTLEAKWDECTMAAMGLPFHEAEHRLVRTLSGGEQKRVVLEALLAGDDEVLLLDEPDNYLDVPGKRWLEERLRDTAKTVLFASHDRELLARAAARIVSVEPAPGGSTVWVHGGGFETYHEARRARFERYDELLRRWHEQHAKLKKLVADPRQYAERSDAMASRYQAAKTRLAKFEQAGPPPEPPRPQDIRVRLHGGRTGVRALTCEHLELGLDSPIHGCCASSEEGSDCATQDGQTTSLDSPGMPNHPVPQTSSTGLTRPFDLEVFFGERVAILGGNGTGKSHFIRLLAGEPVAFAGAWRLGARVVPGYFAQTHAHPELMGRTLAGILWEDHSLDRGAALGALRRYELTRQADQVFETLSGGQQARFQVLALELGGSTMLLLDEPTDNLDLESADALQLALEQYEGTVLAVTHDRWFARTFDRFLIFGTDGQVRESLTPVF